MRKMITYYLRESQAEKMREIEAFQAGAWVHCERPSGEELGKLASNLSLEEELLQDALDPFEVPRMEIEQGIAYIFTRVPQRGKEGIVTTALLIAIGKDFIVTVSRERLDLMEQFTQGKLQISTSQRTNFFLQLMLAIAVVYGKHLTSIGKAVRGLLGRIERIENRDIVRFVEYEHTLNDFISALVPTNAVLKKFLATPSFAVREEDADLVEDLSVETGQLVEMSKTTLKYIVNIRDAYSTIMTNDLNRVIKILTALTIIFTVPTMISSFYGMNVRLPFDQSPWAYLVILGVTLAMIIGFFVVY